ncbi:putative nucleic acid-binding protein [Desulfosalsimonas propionicica]|uniref:Putative nucleic acid-binding protein n=1 Tax=Desulfosalsimonas propionicica TaxID=332175 RepID=A0A7W0CC21_9BACT|nr:type II toxin-antitoxin system VapC family toxin [Desulfosalsimonas propionicica]MBA2882897.1 putative nucleic acid-binding protein [Desulfosalsimonas propionicica]
MSGDNIYLDTSALLPFYREEKASESIQTLLNGIQPPVLLSDLTRVEMASAIARWVRMKEIAEPQAALIENTFNQDIHSGLYLVKSLIATHYQQAEKWLSARKTALRSLDALHIACCWSFHAQLITCDRTMHEAAVLLGLESSLI